MASIGSLISIGPKFWNLRSNFYYGFGLLDVGTHMSFIQLNSGKFLVIDTVALTPPVKGDIDILTNNGQLIDSVIATHPYHTVYFSDFYKNYPKAKYYGTTRHIKNIPTINWVGDITQPENMRLWEEDGIELRIPAGADFNYPVNDNHFSGIFVYHAPSRTIHIDDTITYFEDNKLPTVLWLIGGKAKRFSFHLMIKTALHTPEAPYEFKQWFEKLLNDWDFDNIAVAHNGVVVGGVKEGLKNLLAAKEKFFDELAETNRENQNM